MDTLIGILWMLALISPLILYFVFHYFFNKVKLKKLRKGEGEEINFDGGFASYLDVRFLGHFADTFEKVTEKYLLSSNEYEKIKQTVRSRKKLNMIETGRYKCYKFEVEKKLWAFEKSWSIISALINPSVNTAIVYKGIFFIQSKDFTLKVNKNVYQNVTDYAIIIVFEDGERRTAEVFAP